MSEKPISGHPGDGHREPLVLRGCTGDCRLTDRLVVQAAEDDRLIGELQPLDVQEGVHPVRPGYATDDVAYSDDVIGDVVP